MYAKFFESIATATHFNLIKQSFKKAAMTFTTSAVADMDISGRRYTSILEMPTDFQMSVLSPAVWETCGRADVSGYNKKVIGANGRFSMVQAYNENGQRGNNVRVGREKSMEMDATLGDYDSQEAFIYNMLVSWLKALLSEDAVDGKIKFDQKGFSDSHVKYGLGNGLGDVTLDVTLGAPAPTLHARAIAQRDDLNYWTLPYVLKYNAVTLDQQAFYIAHVFGRERPSKLSFEFRIPSINVDALLLEPLGNDVEDETDFDQIDWTNAELMYTWIRDYVELNRCYKAFSAAMDLLGSLAFNPMPSYHEGIWWNNLLPIVHLAPFTPTRARVAATLDGEMLIDEVDSVDFFRSESLNPIAFLANSALGNYAVMMGLYMVLKNASYDYEDWTMALAAINEDTAMTRGIETRAQLISIVFGKEVTSLATDNCHMDFDFSGMDNNGLNIRNMTVLDPDYVPADKIELVVPYVSGSLFAGCINTELDGYQHLKGVSTVSIPERKTMGLRDSFTIANAYRLFGHQINIRDKRTDRHLEIWTNYREFYLPYFSFEQQYTDSDTFQIISSNQRSGRHDDILNARMLRSGDVLTLTISRVEIRMADYGCKSTLKCAAAKRSTKKIVFTPAVKGGGRHTVKNVKTVRALKRSDEQDFRDAGQDVAPQDPMVGDTGSKTLHASTDDPNLDVDAVD
uniref:Coat protein n=1 Tax=Erysiphales associated totivirus 20 TaxID=2719850 RepID=A0A6G9EME7_9VIRU|nr:coat protein [Erysiphales associated totivirus 20]